MIRKSKFCLSLALMGLGTLGLTGCFQQEMTGSTPTSDLSQPPAVPMGDATLKDPVTGDIYLENPNRRKVPREEMNPSLAKSAAQPLVGTYRDASGQVTINLYECNAYGDPNVRISCSVAADEVLVGGGARVLNWSGSGALLQESRPFDAGLFSWVASSKSHLSGSPHYLYVYAYGMKLTNVSRADLFSRFLVTSATSETAAHPKAVATLPQGMVLVGGGAQVLQNSAGNYLTLSAPHDEGANGPSLPSYRSWYAKSKDHKSSSPAKIVAWAIGMAVAPGTTFVVPIYSNGAFWGDLEVSPSVGTSATVSSGIASQFLGPANGYVVTCPGGYSSWSSGAGRMLFGIFPYFSGTYAQSKDHLTTSAGSVYPSLIQIRKY